MSVADLKNNINKLDTGYGLMSLTWKADPVPEAKAFEAMYRAVELSRERGHKAFFNVGEFYGPDFINLSYVNDFFAKYPDLRKHVVISCKGGIDAATMTPKGSHDDVIQSVKNSVNAIGGYIDIYEVARLDTSLCAKGEVYPFESFEALAEMISEGVIGGISLSEVNEEQIRAIHKDWSKFLTCVEVELSLFSTDILENGIAKTCAELGLTVICYSPLGRGLLTGQLKSNADIPEGDFRKTLKRFSDESLKKNLALVKFLQEEVIDKRPSNNSITLAQLALGWIKHWSKVPEYKGTKFIPIPSGSSISKVDENFDEKKTELTDQEFKTINDFLATFRTVGDRYEMV
ncbi:pyridoxine 4-dehydrogenase SKDI_16G3840 [Saccharomyces kudriavzevii IFO 1802]|uniref:NADP-dependent oxidoreductase domain-containing protein n=1 Tax=Saccharomyces kudriavzevii (strain ATCC MYA-4449 / AS 2.2408 / CBS 8840 / NBRC 1802 / NCYC 2889) TaxID=226230 RepID=A0AA35JBC4_SACK1|nr:uncharacterized protein SKDI_16G3840 [Saccharomyces kudriavzevii IFO 1802]CAI4054038.1 hypothetical protein SKDI_16G3840 [Saccharomyces kudriavzevii IFO 1802]